MKGKIRFFTNRKKLAAFLSATIVISNFSGIPSIAKAEEIHATDLFISEYVEGSSNNKAIEIFNGTGENVDLSKYSIHIGFNGNQPDPTKAVALSGTLENGKCFVVVNGASNADFQKVANAKGNLSFNGDDAILLKHDDQIIDSIGQVGVDPGTEWKNNDVSTLNHTIIRKSNVITGDKNPDDAFDPSIEWECKDQDYIADLGKHTFLNNNEPNNNKVAVEGVTLNKSELNLELAQSEKLIATVSPDNATDKSISWDSSVPGIVSIDGGNVTALQEGTTVVTATTNDGSKKAQCTVTVKKQTAPSSSVISIKDARKLGVNSSATIVGTVNFIDKNNLYVQDDTGSLVIYNGKKLNVFGSIKVGDKIKVTGTTTLYGIMLELVPNAETDVEKVSEGNSLPLSTISSISDITSDMIGGRIKLEKVTLGTINNTANTLVTDSKGNTINIYKMPVVNDVKQGDLVDIVALVSNNKSTLQLRVDSASDITMANLPPDVSAPVIDTTPVTYGNKAVDYEINAKITDDRKVKSAKVFYRTKGDSTYKSKDMTVNADKYTVTIPKEELDVKGLEFYIEASDGTNVTCSPKDTSLPYQVTISEEDIAGPTINKVLPESGYCVGEQLRPEISAEYDDNSGVDVSKVTLSIDDKDVTSKSKIEENKISYIPSEDMSKGNHKVNLTVVDKAVKQNTTIKEWNFTVGKPIYNPYFGMIHAHTAEGSDGQGTYAEAYSFAKDKGKADFFALTDHSNWFDNDATSSFFKNSDYKTDKTENDCLASTKWTNMHKTADQYNEPGKFTAIAAFEMTWSGSTGGWGHINTFNTQGFETRNHSSVDLKKYYDMLSYLPNSISQLNHPGKTFGDFADFSFRTDSVDKTVNLIEVGNGEGPIRGQGYFPSFEYYTRALDKGWHLAPTNNQDNHKGNWILANNARTVALASENTREGIYDAFRNRRVYATEDNDLRISYNVNNQPMGTILGTPEKLNFSISIEDPDAADNIGKVSIIANGGVVVDSKTFDSNKADWNFTLDSKYSYYYVRVDEKDSDIAVTAPVFVGETVPVGISSVSSSQNPMIVGENTQLSAEVFNNGSDMIKNVKVNFYLNEVSDANKIGEAMLDSINPSDKQSVKIDWTPKSKGEYKIYAQTVINVNGVDKVFTQSVSQKVVEKSDICKVVIDASHFNQYVSGDYSGKITALKNILNARNCIPYENKTPITEETLKDAKILILTDPQSKDKTSSGLSKSVYSDEEVAAIKNFVARGGSLIITSRADYDEKGTSNEYHSATQGNKILQAINSDVRFNDDEVIDNTTNGGQNYRLYFKNYTSSKYNLTSGVQSDGKYSFYSGCSIIPKDGADLSKVDFLVKGFDTTETLDSDADGSPNTTPVNKGAVNALSAEVLPNGSKVVVAGTTFFSDFELTGDDLNTNKKISENIIDWMTTKDISVEKIKAVRVDNNKDGKPDRLTEKVTVEGYVTAGSKAAVGNNAFFDVIYVQDETAGITVFGVSTRAIPVGTKVRVTGDVDEYEGDTEIQISDENKDIQVLNDKPVVLEPKAVSTGDSMKESFEGLLVKIQGKVTKVDKDKCNLFINDGTGEARVYVNGYIGSGDPSDTQLGKWDSSIKVGDEVSAIGLASCDAESQRLRVRNTKEIVKVSSGDPTPTPTPDPTPVPDPTPTPIPVPVPSSDTDKNKVVENDAKKIIDQISKNNIKNLLVNTDNNKIVDKSVFQALLGKDIKIDFTTKVQMKNISEIVWSFNGKDLDPKNLKQIDLSVNKVADYEGEIKKIDSDASIISFMNNGVLPAPATLKIKLLDPLKNKKDLYFYYYNPNTKKVELIAGPLTADKEGYLTVKIAHCSDYFISEKVLPVVQKDNDVKNNSTNNVKTIVKTGSAVGSNAVVVLGGVLITIGYVMTRRKKA